LTISKKRKFLFATLVTAILVLSTFVATLTSVRATETPPLLPGASMAPGAIVSAATANSLQWSKGQAYPVVNGKQLPPPDAPSASLQVVPGAAEPTSPPSVSSHWYAGSVWSGTSSLTSWTLAEISVPSTGSSDATEFYYVLMSIWDNAGSYDQIGFAGDYGTWGLTYSYTTGPCSSPTYVYNPAQQALTPGQLYLLAITTVSGPGTWEEVYTVSKTGAITLIFSLHAPTGATDPGLELENFYCGYYDYTDYEEVYGTTTYAQPDPYGAPGGLQFYFHLNCYGPSGCSTFSTWTAWKSSGTPPGTSSSIGKYNTIPETVTINNYKNNVGWEKG